MEIIQERLEREYNLDLVTTAPSVEYKFVLTSGEELTVENVRKCTRVHDRCGTTFMFLVMIISILVFALVNAILGYFGVEFSGVLGKIF